MGSSSNAVEEPPAAGPGGLACRRTTDAPRRFSRTTLSRGPPTTSTAATPPPPPPPQPGCRSAREDGYFRGSQPFRPLLGTNPASTERGESRSRRSSRQIWVNYLKKPRAHRTRAPPYALRVYSGAGPLLTGSTRDNYCSPSVPMRTTTEPPATAAKAQDAPDARARLLERAGVPCFSRKTRPAEL